MTPQEINNLIAEKVMGWKRVSAYTPAQTTIEDDIVDRRLGTKPPDVRTDDQWEGPETPRHTHVNCGKGYTCRLKVSRPYLCGNDFWEPAWRVEHALLALNRLRGIPERTDAEAEGICAEIIRELSNVAR